MKNLIIVLGLAFAVAGCAAQEQGLRYDRTAPKTFDGLTRIANTQVDAAWVREGFDPSRYSKIMFVGKGIEYADVTPMAQSALNPVMNQIPITDEQKNRFGSIVREEFADELGNVEAFEITRSRGPDVLIVSAGLVDVVSSAPPERVGDSDIYLPGSGAASLLIEFIDGSSNRMQLRAVDRQFAGRAGSELDGATEVTTWDDARQMARHWARMLREDLDELTNVAATLR